jgi:hypothetical protein
MPLKGCNCFILQRHLCSGQGREGDLPLINLKAGDPYLLRVRAIQDCSRLRLTFAPMLVEEQLPFGAGAYIAKVLAPFTELAGMFDEDDLARLRLPREIDPATAKR